MKGPVLVQFKKTVLIELFRNDAFSEKEKKKTSDKIPCWLDLKKKHKFVLYLKHSIIFFYRRLKLKINITSIKKLRFSYFAYIYI